MALPLIPIVMALANTVPGLVGLLKGPKARQTAEAVVDIAKTVTGQTEPQAAVDAVAQNPELLLRFKLALLDHELAMRKADVDQLAEVNQTMRAEVVSTDAYNRRWRATFGYAVAFAWAYLFLGVVTVIGYAVIEKTEKAGEIIAAIGAMVSSTAMLWTVALSVLGVTVYKRSQDKETALGAERKGLLEIASGIFKR